jgi:hypothetical protein
MVQVVDHIRYGLKELLICIEKNIFQQNNDLIENWKLNLQTLFKDFVEYERNNQLTGLNLFSDVTAYISLVESKTDHRPIRVDYTKALKDIFGSDSAFVADYCKTTALHQLIDQITLFLIFNLLVVAFAVAEDNIGNLDTAIDYAGRALLIRVEKLGVINPNTAESHYILGSLYVKKELYDDGRQEICSSKLSTTVSFCFVIRPTLILSADLRSNNLY